MKNIKKYIIIEAIITISILLILLIIILLISSNSSKNIPAIINSNNTALDIKKSNNNPILSKGDKIVIVEENDNNYLVETNNQKGYVEKDKVTYFQFNDNQENQSLVLDVSKFNMSNDNSSGNSNKNFSDSTDFAKFIVDNNINYTYIRLCGRGWGSEGNMYNDDKAFVYTDICEYLKIPYGFYYIEEAKNDNEVLEEVKYVNSLLDGKELSMNVLPLALDLEYQHGKGRTDDIWDTRVPLVNKLVEEFKKTGIDTIVYANGARIEKYLKSANCKFWVAMYPENDKIPVTDYKTFIIEEQSKIGTLKESISDSVLNSDVNKSETEIVTYSDEFLNKVVGWQFTENGAKEDGINDFIDLSLFDTKYLKQFIN